MCLGSGNIAGDSLELRNLVLDNGALTSMKALCRQPFTESMCLATSSPQSAGKGEFVSMLRNLSWSLSNLCRFGKHREQHWRDLVQCLADLLRRSEALSADEADRSAEGLGANIGWSFCYLTNDMNSERDTVPLLDAMKRLQATSLLIALLGSANPFTVHSTMRAVGNVLTGNDRYTAHCIDCGVLQRLNALMHRFYAQSVNHEKLKEICWAISNVTAGPTEQIVKVIEAQFVPILMSVLKGSRTVIAAEALWAVSNATASANERVMSYLVGHGLIEGLCQFLRNKFGAASYHRSSEKLLMATLECIDHILSSDKAHADRFEECGGVDFLEFLQSEDAVSQSLYDFAVRLITTHFDGEQDGDDDDIATNNSNSNNTNCNTKDTANGDGAHFSFGVNLQQSQLGGNSNHNQFEF